MLYINISENKAWIVKNSIKVQVAPGGIVNVTPTDVNHSGESMMFFESVTKRNIVDENKWHKPTLTTTVEPIKTTEPPIITTTPHPVRIKHHDHNTK